MAFSRKFFVPPNILHYQLREAIGQGNNQFGPGHQENSQSNHVDGLCHDYWYNSKYQFFSVALITGVTPQFAVEAQRWIQSMAHLSDIALQRCPGYAEAFLQFLAAYEVPRAKDLIDLIDTLHANHANFSQVC